MFPPPTIGEEPPGNGIVVGRPKVFDNQTLERMLEDLDTQLQQLRLIRQDPIAGAMGDLQGSQIRQVERSLDLSQNPLPAVETERTPTDDGDLVTSKEATSTAALTPAAPSLGAATAATLPVSNFAPAAQDILSEQIDLQYQVYNLRALLNRSVTDRHFTAGATGGGTRMQALLGFQISLDPRREHKGAAAVVEITVEHVQGGKAAPSLVALMPLQKTYNAAALSERSNAFGGAALASVFSIGYSERRRGQTFYLYRDADTFAFERPVASAPSAIGFGWQFRPVLNRPSVDPGIRQLFAVLALDQEDSPARTRQPTGDFSDLAAVPLRVTARTYWLKYDRKRRVTKGRLRDHEAAYDLQPFPVAHAATLHEDLAPKVQRVTVVPLDDETVRVEVDGKNFGLDTSVALGNRILPAASPSFSVRSSNRLTFAAPIRDILAGKVSLTGGRYGFPAPVEDEQAKDAASQGFELAAFGPGGQRRGGFVDFRIELRGRGSPIAPVLHDRDVFLELGKSVYRLDRWTPCSTVHRGADVPGLCSSIEIPISMILEDQDVTATVPFFGKAYRSSGRFHPPIGVTKLVVLAASDPPAWGIVGHGFDQDANVQGMRVQAFEDLTLGAGLERIVIGTDPATGTPIYHKHLIRMSPPKAHLGTIKQVIVTLPDAFEPVALSAPTVSKPKPKTAVTGPQPTVAKNSSGSVVFEGTGFKQVERVLFGSKILRTKAVSDKKLRVFLTREVTAASGPVTLFAYTGKESFVALELTIQ